MLNVVFLIGELLDIDQINGTLRTMKILTDYKNLKGEMQSDLILVSSWNRTNKGELFSLEKGSFVLVKGRLEVINQKCIVVCEDLSYLGKK